MVAASPIAASTTVEITHRAGTFQYSPSDIVDGLTITWGRTSIFEPPAKRLLSMTLRLDYAAARSREWATMLYGAITVRRSGECIFTGFIDSVEFNRRDDDHWLVDVSAAEGTGFNPLLSRKLGVFMPQATVSVLRQELEYRSRKEGITKPKILKPVRDDFFFFMTDKATEATYEQLWGAVAAPFPLAFPSWSPDYTQVAPTKHDFSRTYGIAVSPKEVVGTDPQFHAESLPPLVRLSSRDGVLGFDLTKHKNGAWENGDIIRETKEMNYTEWKVVKNAADSASSQSGYVNQAFSVLRAQITDPRTLTFHDDVVISSDLKKALSSVFTTWETGLHINVWPPSDADSFVELFGLSPTWEPIGGRLIITAARTTSELTCVWATDHPLSDIAVRLRNQWQDNRKPWQDEPDKWIDE